jgi:hypothetical protein
MLRPGALLCLLLAVGCGSQSSPVEPGPSQPPPPPPPGTPPPSYQFGAKFEPPIGRVVHGMGQWEVFNPKYTALLATQSQPASELIFLAIGDTIRPWNPVQIAARVAGIGAAGRIPLADIGLRGNQPTAAELAKLPDPLFGIDHEVANGTKWDSRLQDLANLFAAYRKPALVRIGGEFNGWWNGYHPYEFPRAFRKIVNLFRAAGALNVAFVWCYEPAGPGDFADQNASGAYKWFPGEDVIDWFSIDLFAVADLSGPTSAHRTSTNYGRTLSFLDFAVSKAKPVVIAESAPFEFNLSNPSEANQSWTKWFVPYFGLITQRPEVKWFTYVNFDWTLSSYYVASGWKNNDMSQSPFVATSYAAELANPKYLHAGELALLKDFGLYK